jgi:hypothetical protein
MKNRDLFDLLNGLNAVSGLKGVKFAYAVARNISLLTPICTDLEKSVKPSDKYLEYENRRRELAIEFARKDAEGHPMMAGNQIFLADAKAFQTKIVTVEEEYKDEIAEQKKKIEEYEKLLDEPAEKVELRHIQLETIPEDVTPDLLTRLIPIIDE